MPRSRRDQVGPDETTALVAGVAHEINNPITYVLANLAELERSCGAITQTLASYRALLRDSGIEDAESCIAELESKLDENGGLDLAAELLRDATEGAQRIRDLVRELLSLSRSGERTSSKLSISDVLEQTLRPVARSLASRADLERDLAATREIEGDRARLGQVFLNLLQNAIDACASSPGREHRIVLRTRDTADGVRVEIEDTGPGVSGEVASSIFAPFFTTKSPSAGTGLGLYISRRIVAEHGGTLELVPSSGGGAIFRVDLPASGQDPSLRT